MSDVEPLAERLAYWRQYGAPGLPGRGRVARPQERLVVDERTGERSKVTTVVGDEGPHRGTVVGRQVEHPNSLDAVATKVAVTVNPSLRAKRIEVAP